MPNKEIPEEIGQGKVALTIWSPVGHTVAWIRDNDLYVTIDGEKEYQITNDGSKTIINGIADWVYEEEVYGGNVAMWFSLDASRLAFLKFNESSVPDYRVEYYMNGANPYPREVTIKYPKAGAPNPIATLHIASPYAEKVEHRSLPVIFNENENFADENRLIVEVDWLSSDELLVRLMNRVQDYQRVFIASPRTEENGNSVSWVARMIRDEQSTDGAWYNVLQAAKVIPPSNSRNYSSYIEMAENAHGYMHIAYYRSIEESKPTMWLTSGSFEVTEILSVDVETDLITEEGSTQRHLYSVQLDGSEKMKLTPPKNMTLRQPFRTYNKTTSEKSDDELGYYSAQFSPKSKYFILKYMGPGVPFSKIYRTADKEPVGVLSMNDPIHEALLKKDLPLQGIITLPNDNGDEMNTKMMFPPDFDINKKYPVLMKVYGGPSSQSVSHAFSVDFMAAVAGSMGFVSVIVDGRGTGAKGRKFRSSVSKNLGFYEALDQITAAKKIAAMPFVDLNRIAIWGWSYGGYTTLKTLEANSGVFALGMAVAPVTNWKYYDSVYTERYMKTPQINPLGYEESSVRKMDGFKQSKLLLIHGTADDNVHFQNTAALIWKLTGEAVRNYQVQVFTDSDHSIYENGAHAEVYDLMRRYLIENFVDNKLNSTIKRSQIASLIEPVSNSKR
ncbi:hypothetical protein HK098_003612 [Nowakowskiella sp. JEL0407]|nr:hypothetical protein HK098_003612 [Nowakowskiella sp. JEL0407]